jgi:membrane fusion protein, multidrug efflux system
MRLDRNVITALVIAGVIVIWLASGQIGGRHPAEAADAQQQTTTKVAGKLFTVRAQKLHAEAQAAELVIRGRTEAVRSVNLKSETAGTVSKLDVEKGARVKAGDIICELQPDAREAQLEQARAAMKQAELEFQASSQLAKKGYRSPTDVAGSKAKLDAASAAVRQAEIELARTKLRAPFDGVVDDRMVEVGDFVQPGGNCARVVDLDPMLVVGQVSEKDIGQLSVGQPGHAQLMDGSNHDGHLRFVAKSADQATRTFRVELEVPNPDGAVRDGLTADIRVPVKAVMAQKISPAILGLDEKGVMGVRTVDKDNIVRFFPVKVVSDAGDGVWVSGLPADATVITVGQEYVVPGQKVDVALESDGAKS